jgi:hypothetical protein
VLPAICTEEVITLGAELEDGTVIRGQNNISHPNGCSESGGPGRVLGVSVRVFRAQQAFRVEGFRVLESSAGFQY